MSHAREQSCQGTLLLSLWLSTLCIMAHRFLEVDLDPFRKRIEFNWGLLHSIFLAVEQFSTNIELPHILSHFVRSPAAEAASAGQFQVCRLELLRAWLGVCWDFCQWEPEHFWASGIFRVSWELKQDVWSISCSCRCLSDPFVDQTAPRPWGAHPLVTPVGFRRCSHIQAAPTGWAVPCWGCGQSSHQGSLPLCELQLKLCP